MNQRLIASLVAPLAIAAASAAHADTATINTTATILATCKFQSLPVTGMAFDDIDPGSGDAVTKEITVQFSCTKDSSVKFAVNDKETGPVNGTLTQGTNTLGYTVSWDAPTGLAKGHSKANWTSVTLTGSIAKEAFQDAVAGKYSDATGLTLSVNP